MKIVVYLYDKIYNYNLPDEVLGSFSFDPEDNDDKLINIEARGNQWILYNTSAVKVSCNNAQLSEIALQIGKYYILERNNQVYVLYVKSNNMNGFLPYKYENGLKLTVGNMTNASIEYHCDTFNNTVVGFGFTENKLIITNDSSKPFYVNNNYTKSKQVVLSYGDEIDLLGLKIIYLKQFLMLFNTENIKINSLHFQNNLLRFPKLDEIRDLEINDEDLYKKEEYFFKSPRIRRNIETKEIEFAKPPESKLTEEMPVILTVGPMATMGLISVVTMLNTVSKLISKQTTLANSWSSLLTSIIMLISMLVWPLVTRTYQTRRRKKALKEITARYMKYLDSKKIILNEEQKLQKEILSENLITVEECLQIIENKGVNFWDKRLDQDDFLTLRIGSGNIPLSVSFKYETEEFSAQENEIKDKVEDVIEKNKELINVPMGYSFYENKISAIMGNYEATSNFLHNLILQILTFYSYEDLKIVFFTNDKRVSEWEYLKYTNHCFNNDKSFRFFASDVDSAKEVSDYLNREFNDRKSQQTGEEKNVSKPYYVIITDDYEKIKRYEFTKNMTESNINLGFSLIILENKLGNLPSKCNNFINIGQNKSTVLINAYEKQEQIEFYNEIRYGIDMMSVVKKISNVPIEFESGNTFLPNSVTFLEMEKVGRVEQLNILNRWNMSDATKTLKAEIGMDEFGDLMYLDLHEKNQGPHGLIAGMTGSGKSEFIITYILSMAINYSPEFVSFILIDYKGGGLAYAFENKQLGISLPHLAGIITNLDKAEMNRTLVSIDSEIKRRQNCFNIAREQLGESTMDIYKYQNYYKEGKVTEPIPHLCIICDEFAELKSQQPEFMDNLISVARIGRSLGVHLILATQKPSGVVNDQIWSNTRFRVCLKVQDESDSSEVLKRKDAAYLKNVGRFYLQVGFDEYFALGQSAWCGANYYPSDRTLKQANKSVDFINDYGSLIKSIEGENNKLGIAQGEQISAVLKSVVQTAQDTNKKATRLWLENIPDVTYVKDLEQKYNIIIEPYNVKAIIGEYDAPEIQQQGLVEYNFLDDGNTIIYGSDGIDKEMLLNEIIYSSTKNHSVDEINYYIVDYGSESLGRWTKLPHVGGVVYSSEQEEFDNLIKLLKAELQMRKKLFVDYGGDYKNYIKNKKGIPLKVVILNNYESIVESNYNLSEEFGEIIRDSSRYGIVYIVTASAQNAISSRIEQSFSNKYILRLNNVNDMMFMFNQKTTIIPRDVQGRGLLDQGVIHEFQTASIVPEEQLTDFIMNYVVEQNNINQNKAKIIPILPEVVTYDFIQQYISGLNKVPIGINKQTLEVEVVDYLDNICNIISSYKLEDTKNFAISLLSILSQINNNNLFILDTTDLLNLDRNSYPNYYKDNFDYILERLNSYVDELISKDVESTGILFIYGMNKLLTKINNPTLIDILFAKLKQHEKISIIIVEEASKLKNRAFEGWLANNFDLTQGLWIGHGIFDQSLFRVPFMGMQENQELKNDMGYIIKDANIVLCKMIDFTDKTEEDFYE